MTYRKYHATTTVGGPLSPIPVSIRVIGYPTNRVACLLGEECTFLTPEEALRIATALTEAAQVAQANAADETE